jgi:hypothetical protein
MNILSIFCKDESIIFLQIALHFLTQLAINYHKIGVRYAFGCIRMGINELGQLLRPDLFIAILFESIK